MTHEAVRVSASCRVVEEGFVFITAPGDESTRPRMLDAGAVECLFKPFSEKALLDAVTTAFRLS